MIILRELYRMYWVPTSLAGLMVSVTLVLGEPRLSLGFVVMALTSMVSQGLLWGVGHQSRDWHAMSASTPSRASRFATTACAWLLFPIYGALPLLIAAWFDPRASIFAAPLNALFEAYSGFTSTGLTMAESPSSLPASLQLWRSLMQWVGGLGIALITLLLINPHQDDNNLPQTDIRVDLPCSPHRKAGYVVVIYLVFTCLACLCLSLTGVSPWEALNHGLTAVSTGGFTITDDSLAGYSSSQQGVMAAFIILGTLGFGFYYALLNVRRQWLWHQHSQVLVWCLLLALLLSLLFLGRDRFGLTLPAPDILFQGFSALATAGFSTAPVRDWHSAFLMLLLVAMMIGGCSGSTAGGVKVDRMQLVNKAIFWRARDLFDHGRRPTVHHIKGNSYTGIQARLKAEAAATLVLFWLLGLSLGCLVLAPAVGEEWTISQVAFEVASAESGVGLSVGITTPALPAAAKLTLMLLMWAGRLEFIAVLVLLASPVRSALVYMREAAS